jgi:hypothetical protein
VHTVYTFGWKDPRSGNDRPITTRAAVFLVPETANRTRIDMFLFLKIAPSIYRRFGRVMYALARHISGMELKRDVRLIESVADGPRSLDQMRLTRFDHAVIHNRKLLRSVYWLTPDPMSAGATIEAQNDANGSQKCEELVSSVVAPARGIGPLPKEACK